MDCITQNKLLEFLAVLVIDSLFENDVSNTARTIDLGAHIWGELGWWIISNWLPRYSSKPNFRANWSLGLINLAPNALDPPSKVTLFTGFQGNYTGIASGQPRDLDIRLQYKLSNEQCECRFEMKTGVPACKTNLFNLISFCNETQMSSGMILPKLEISKLSSPSTS